MGTYDHWTQPPFEGDEHGAPYFTITDGIRVYDVRGMFTDTFPQDSPVEKMGYTAHHAAVVLGGDTVAHDLATIRAIHSHHVNTNGWGGIGYHRIIGNGRRIYITGTSGSQRAHVAALNHQWIGWCFLGDWSNGRPTEDMMLTFRTGVQWETDRRGVPMQLAPHKRLNPGTACPGSWAGVDAWAGLVLRPQAPAPPPLPTPEPPPGPDVQGALVHIHEAARLLGG